MKVYRVNAGDGEPAMAFATKRAALKEARVAADQYCPVGESVTVEEVTLVPITKAVIVNLINVAGRYVQRTRTIATLPSAKF